MRLLLASVLLACTACKPWLEEMRAKAKENEAEMLRQAEVKQSVQAFGGTVIGKDEGEWGGEVAFREPDGTTYQLIPDNSHGIFDMPYGVVALTGLAHLRTNRGSVHVLSRDKGSRVKATKTLQLPGAPCDVMRRGDQVHMRVFTGFSASDSGGSKPQYHCYALQSEAELSPEQCPVPEPTICFG